MDGDGPESVVLGIFVLLRESWGRSIPTGNSPEKRFMQFVFVLKRQLGSPKFLVALGMLEKRMVPCNDALDLSRLKTARP